MYIFCCVTRFKLFHTPFVRKECCFLVNLDKLDKKERHFFKGNDTLFETKGVHSNLDDGPRPCISDIGITVQSIYENIPAQRFATVAWELSAPPSCPGDMGE